ncbi:ATP-binding cassette domain-containing protein [Methylopila musalis]|uniref:ATP-binding cassette domain-containing protein n=1 Tax=Methylopila musalis TaxID=1134781 RepID=A0ABW3Z5Q5_9HYPH
MTARSFSARLLSPLGLAAAFSPASAPKPTQLRAAGGRGASVTLRGFSKSFGPKKVLQKLDLHVPAGQFLAIVGKSGCGKSTLLRAILGLDQPTEGVVTVADQPPTSESARIMFQEPRLLPWARVLDNVLVGVRGLADKAQAREAALDVLRKVGLVDRIGEWPSVLSGGQKQRVALARALVSRPRLLALDEPLGALDALTRIEMQGLLERIWQEQGFTAVLVTHDVSEALALADRVIVLEDGGVSLDLAVDLPRPRRRGSPAIARLEGQILDRLFGAAERDAAPADEAQELYA